MSIGVWLINEPLTNVIDLASLAASLVLLFAVLAFASLFLLARRWLTGRDLLVYFTRARTCRA